MSYAPRPTTVFPSSTTSSLRQPSLGGANTQQSSTIAARIAAKRQELENLEQLRDLSGALAAQMAALEQKLATLRDGTEAVACVLANWDNVLRAINMASCKLFQNRMDLYPTESIAAKMPQPTSDLPVTLVRIPVQSHHEDKSNGKHDANGG